MNPIIDGMFVFIAFLLIVIFISSLSLIIGLINPKILNKFFKTKKFNRKNIFVSWIITILISIILGFIGITIDENSLDKQVERFKKGELVSISPAIAERYFFKNDTNPPTCNLTSITAGVLGVFKKHSVDVLCLDGLTNMPLDIAKIIKDMGLVEISLNGLKDISPEVMSQFKYIRFVSYNGLETISSDVAKEIGGYHIQLNGLKTINSTEVAKELTNTGSVYLELKGVESISPDAAKELAKSKNLLDVSSYLSKEIYKYNYSPSEELIKAFY